MLKLKMSRDINGNKTVTVKVGDTRGFSIQTNGNLPNTHRSGVPGKEEILDWVDKFGTLRQKVNIQAVR